VISSRAAPRCLIWLIQSGRLPTSVEPTHNSCKPGNSFTWLHPEPGPHQPGPHQEPEVVFAARSVTRAMATSCLHCAAIAVTANAKVVPRPWRRSPAARFRVTKGTPKRFVAQADSGNEIARAFCGDCGTPLYVQVATRPDVVGLRVCTLDDPGWFRPEADIFVKSAQPWEPVDAAVPRYPDYPPGKSYPVGGGR
jgi:hypothetical protein